MRLSTIAAAALLLLMLSSTESVQRSSAAETTVHDTQLAAALQRSHHKAQSKCRHQTKLVLYWGQNSYGATHGGDQNNWEKRLSYYCESGLVGTVVLSFMHIFGLAPEVQMDYANHCPPTQLFPDTRMLNCPELRGDIHRCQELGVKVELGLGGAAGSYGFNSREQAEGFAKQLWTMAFTARNTVSADMVSAGHPFGDIVLDGVNLDIEGGNPLEYTAFVQYLRRLHARASKQQQRQHGGSKIRPLYVTAAPQCPYPDAYMHDVLINAEIDAVYVQFYNNYCGTQAFGTTNFNFDIWDEWSNNHAKVHGAKVFLGVPASTTAANIGYAPPQKLRDIVTAVQAKYPSFGGVMMWDTSQAFGNRVDDEQNYAQTTVHMLREACGHPAATERVHDREHDGDTASVSHGEVAAPANGGNESHMPATPTVEPAATPTSNLAGAPSTLLAASPTPISTVSPTGTDCPTMNGSCTEGTFDCNGDSFAQCVFGRWVLRGCKTGTICHRTADLNSVFCDLPSGEQMTCGKQLSARQRLSMLTEGQQQHLQQQQQQHRGRIHQQQLPGEHHPPPTSDVRMVYLTANGTHMTALASAYAGSGSGPFERHWEVQVSVPVGTHIVSAVRTQAKYAADAGGNAPLAVEAVPGVVEAAEVGTHQHALLRHPTFIIHSNPEVEPELSMRVDMLLTLAVDGTEQPGLANTASSANNTIAGNDNGEVEVEEKEEAGAEEEALVVAAGRGGAVRMTAKTASPRRVVHRRISRQSFRRHRHRV